MRSEGNKIILYNGDCLIESDKIESGSVDLIKTFSNENDLVVDLTMGSGSTGVACRNTNRNFIGIAYKCTDAVFLNLCITVACMKRSHAQHLIQTTNLNWLCFIHVVIASTVY